MSRSVRSLAVVLAALLLGCGFNNDPPSLAEAERPATFAGSCWLLLELGPEDPSLPRVWEHDAAAPECSMTICLEAPGPPGVFRERAACRSCEGSWTERERGDLLRLNGIECTGDACGCDTPWMEWPHQDMYVVAWTEDELVLWGHAADGFELWYWRFARAD